MKKKFTGIIDKLASSFTVTRLLPRPVTRFLWRQKKMGERVVSHGQRKAYNLLFEAMRDHSFIYIRPVAGRTLFQSVLLDVNLKEQFILIDELFPNVGYQVAPNDRFEVSIGKKGCTFNFVAELLMAGEYAGTAFYKLSLPEVVEEEQRRSTYRVELPENIESVAIWRWPDGGEAMAAIIDISMNGVKLKVATDPERLHVGKCLQGVVLQVGDELDIQSDIEVRHVEYENVRSRDESAILSLGAELVAVEPTDHAALQRFMHKLQRAHRRHQLSSAQG